MDRFWRTLAQQLVARAERAQVIAGVGQVGRVPVLDGPVEQPPPPLGPSLHERQVVRREADHCQAAEQLVGIAHRFAVHSRRSTAVRHRHLDLAHSSWQLEPPRDRGLLPSETHQLGEPLRAKRAQRAEQVAGLEEVGLPLPVRAEQHGRVRRKLHALIGQIAKRPSRYVKKKHA